MNEIDIDLDDLEFDTDEIVSNLEFQYPHILEGVLKLWHSQAFEIFIEGLILLEQMPTDATFQKEYIRNGEVFRGRNYIRQGFNHEFMDELIFLYNIHATMYNTIRRETGIANKWDQKIEYTPLEFK